MSESVATLRHNWTVPEARAVHDTPLFALLDRARSVHRAHHPDGKVQLCTLLSVKTGGCPEDCSYCPQSSHYESNVGAERMLDGLARDQRRPRLRARARHGARGQRPRPRGLRHPRHAQRKPGPAPQRGRPRRLQPQPRHQPRRLPVDHLDPHLRRPPRHPRARAPCRHHRLQRRHHRHGRIDRRSRRHARRTRPPRTPPRECSRQRPRALARHPPRTPAPRARPRARAHGRHRPHHDAPRARAPQRRPHRALRRSPDHGPLRRRQLDLLRRQAAHHAQPRRERRPPPPRARWPRAPRSLSVTRRTPG